MGNPIALLAEACAPQRRCLLNADVDADELRRLADHDAQALGLTVLGEVEVDHPSDILTGAVITTGAFRVVRHG